VQVHDMATQRRVAQGVLTLGLEDLLWQLTTVRTEPPPGVVRALENQVPAARNAIANAYLAKFGALFGSTLFNAYGGLLASLNNEAAPLPEAQRPLRLPSPERTTLDVGGGFGIGLTRYRGGPRGPVILASGFSMRASSFIADTVDENIVEALCAQRYDVWLLDYRGSPDAVGSQGRYCMDDIARIDWPAAVAHVRSVTGADSVQVLGHCVGSMSILMALLEGLQGVRSVVSSQLTLHPLTGWLNDTKADLGLARLLETVSALDGCFDTVPGTTDLDHQIDVLAWNVPVAAGQACKSPLCHRVNAIFGCLLAHEQINEATHQALPAMFGRVSLSPFEQLTLIMQRGRVVDAQGRDDYLTPEKAARLALPISFLAGSANQLFFPEGSLRTQRWLSTHNDPALYTRRTLPGYAHMDCFVGRNAHRDVFPTILAELARGDETT